MDEKWRELVGRGGKVALKKANFFFFFFQAEDGIRDLVRSRGLGDVYKSQILLGRVGNTHRHTGQLSQRGKAGIRLSRDTQLLSPIHI